MSVASASRTDLGGNHGTRCSGTAEAGTCATYDVQCEAPLVRAARGGGGGSRGPYVQYDNAPGRPCQLRD